MYLKKLEILGFKSFSEKTTVKFANGVTAIVGPNGCGKTNILDALRWVLGEQKASLLRGSKMEEVIFNGTRDVKPLGMAEVTLTIHNDRGVLPVEYNMLQITRRLFRSGESEYLLNKVPCRLKDITELFFDTGMGAHSYSVIQQDMIEAVISDKAEERRFLFEEAAGITKYKQRKKAAMRKLDATENDFLRLKDIYAEVRTQVNSLNRQQKKAERYKMVADDIRAWELYLSSQRLKEIDGQRRQTRARLDALSTQLSDKQTKVDLISAQLEADHKEQIDVEHELTHVGSKVFEITEQAHTLEKEISILGEKRTSARTTIERNRDDINGLTARKSIIAEQVAVDQKLFEEQTASLNEIVAQLTEAENQQAAADTRLMAARSSREQKNKMLIELEGRLSSGKTEDDNLKQQVQEISELISELEAQAAQQREKLEQFVGERDERQQRVNELEERRSDTGSQLDNMNEQIETLIEQNEELALEMSNFNASIEASQARQSLLEEMILSYEGYESGVVSAMEVRDRWPAIAGTVAERIVPVAGMEAAVEAALGETARFIICRQRSTAEEIIDYLRSEKKGRIGILVPQTGTINPAVRRPEIDLEEFVGWLDAYVSTDDELRPLMQAVLSRTAVFKAGSNPQELLTRLPYGFRAVSTDGRLYTGNSISGGAEDQLPLFRRKENLAEQVQIEKVLIEKLKQATDTRNRQTSQLAEARASASSLTQQLEALAEQASELQHSLQEATYRKGTADNEIARLEKETGHQRTRLEAIRTRQYSLGLDFDQMALKRQEIETVVAESGGELHEIEEAAARALEHLSSLQVTQVEARSKIEQTQSKLEHQEALSSELQNTISTKQSEINQAGEDIESSTTRIEQQEIELRATFERREEVTTAQSDLQRRQTEVTERVSERDKNARILRNEKDNLSEEHHQLEIRLTTMESEVSTLLDRMREDYEIELHDIDAPRPEAEFNDEEASDHLASQKDRLKKFGAVNLLALEEYRVASEREQFLREQMADLETAKTDLLDTINRINETARKLFTDTFDKVKVNFQGLFLDLFSGGEANISLVNPDDPLESDIDISARPRGKKVLSITMMSGGERALTAISLLFALYMVKPSPFCILDEIDAPLDDANCHRFLKMIRTFAGQTQFIVITHNKITMEASNNLYGITMDRPGISRVVGVKFNEAETDDPEKILQVSSTEETETDDFAPAVEESTDDADRPEVNEPVMTDQPEVDDSEKTDEDVVLPERVVERITPKIEIDGSNQDEHEDTPEQPVEVIATSNNGDGADAEESGDVTNEATDDSAEDTTDEVQLPDSVLERITPKIETEPSGDDAQ